MPNRRRCSAVLFIGDDWAEAHHDIELVDEAGRRLARRRLPEGVDGLAALHALVADHLDEDAEADQVRGRDRDRPRAVGAGADRRRLHRLRGQSAAGGPLPGTARHLRRQERPRRRARAGRAGAPGPGPSPPGGRGLRAGRARQGARPHPPVDDLVPAAADQRAALDAARVLPGRAGRLRRGPGRPRRPGGPGDRPVTRGRPPALPVARSPRRCGGPGGNATSTPPPSGSRPRCAPRSWRPTPAWSAPTPPRCARWSP